MVEIFLPFWTRKVPSSRLSSRKFTEILRSECRAAVLSSLVIVSFCGCLLNSEKKVSWRLNDWRLTCFTMCNYWTIHETLSSTNSIEVDSTNLTKESTRRSVPSCAHNCMKFFGWVDCLSMRETPIGNYSFNHSSFTGTSPGGCSTGP